MIYTEKNNGNIEKQNLKCKTSNDYLTIQLYVTKNI